MKLLGTHKSCKTDSRRYRQSERPTTGTYFEYLINSPIK